MRLDRLQTQRKTTIKHLVAKAFRGDRRINAISPADKLTALQLAIKRGWLHLVDILLEAGGDR